MIFKMIVLYPSHFVACSFKVLSKKGTTHILFKCFNKDYEHLFDVPYSARIDNDATFQPPADGARSLVSSPVKGFYRR